METQNGRRVSSEHSPFSLGMAFAVQGWRTEMAKDTLALSQGTSKPPEAPSRLLPAGSQRQVRLQACSRCNLYLGAHLVFPRLKLTFVPIRATLHWYHGSLSGLFCVPKHSAKPFVTPMSLILTSLGQDTKTSSNQLWPSLR